MEAPRKIGLLFGSFNPIHSGHLIIANFMVTQAELDAVWFVVSPQNPLKSTAELAPQEDRFEMVKISTADNPRFFVSDVEFGLPTPSYTIQTLQHLRESFPEDNFTLIIGGDNFKLFDKWKEYRRILTEFQVFVYRRPGYNLTESIDFGNFKIYDAPYLYISATYIRSCIRNGISIKYLVPEPVINYIDRFQLYAASDESELS